MLSCSRTGFLFNLRDKLSSEKRETRYPRSPSLTCLVSNPSFNSCDAARLHIAFWKFFVYYYWNTKNKLYKGEKWNICLMVASIRILLLDIMIERSFCASTRCSFFLNKPLMHSSISKALNYLTTNRMEHNIFVFSYFA